LFQHPGAVPTTLMMNWYLNRCTELNFDHSEVSVS
jgi:hypothetical protein